MNISTVAANLRNTIKSKELLLSELRARTGIKRESVDHIVFVASIEFLKINIDELKKVLEDVEQCIPKEPEFDESDSEEVRNLIRMGR